MWYPISKLLLKQEKRKVLEQNRVLTAFAFVAYLFIQIVTFSVLYFLAGDVIAKMGHSSLMKGLLWFSFITYSVSLVIIYLFARKFPPALLTLPYSKTTLYQSFHIPTVFFVSLLWIGQFGFYLPFLIHMQLGIFTVHAFVGYVIITSMQTIFAGLSYNVMNMLHKYKFGKTQVVQGFVLIGLSVLSGLYYVKWAGDSIRINPALWYGQAMEGKETFLFLLMILAICAGLLLALSYRWVSLPIQAYAYKVKPVPFTSHPFINDVLLVVLFFVRDSERRKSLWISFFVGLVLIDGLYLLFDIHNEWFFYLYIMVLGLGTAHVMVLNESEEKPLTRFSLDYPKFLLAKVTIAIFISVSLLTLSILLSLIIGYPLETSFFPVLYSSHLLFVSIGSWMRLVFLNYGTMGEASYSMLSMILFGLFSFVTGSWVPRVLTWIEPSLVIAVCNILLTFVVFTLYAKRYSAKLIEGGAYQ